LPEQSASSQPAFGPAYHLQKLEQVAFRHWLAVIEALGILAAYRAQEDHVVLGLDAFGHDLLSELVGKRDDGAQDHGSGAVLRARLHECAVDLDRIERKLGEIRERGIAGAEVVNGEAGARGRKLFKHRGRLLRVLHGERFGDFEPKRALGQNRPA
jgi:hypothetical protein